LAVRLLELGVSHHVTSQSGITLAEECVARSRKKVISALRARNVVIPEEVEEEEEEDNIFAGMTLGND